MKNKSMLDYLRSGLMMMLLCVAGTPHLAGAAPAIPTSPTTGYFAPGQTTPTPDYYTTANWANTPPLAKFVDTLPGLGAANNLGQMLTVAVPDTVTYPGTDYYEIDLVEYTEQMHRDLNPTKLRGYVQVNAPAGSSSLTPHYLGPIIVANRDVPVRVKFTNRLPNGTAGNLFIPVDKSVMGAGKGPALADGTVCNNTVEPNNCASYTENRAAIHLHGGRTPWISDGTPHQWITPVGEVTPFKKGVSLQNVPDMPDPGDGSTTYYFTNQQSARLMFYHDHAFGITRLNVYAGEAAGYVITDKYEQDLVTRGLLPSDQIPLIIQDKTFVDATPTPHPVTGVMTPKVRITDPLWNWGSDPAVGGVVPPKTGDLWLPHVYMPAQTMTAGIGGVNPFGRWMYGPWFFPATVVEKGPVANPYYDPNCSSPDPLLLAQCQTPGQPVQIPGTPNISMGMEAFQDSAMVNGTLFPSLTVDPRAYRFRILNAASDRFQNLSFYVADPAQLSPDTRPASRLTEVKMVPASPALAAANNWPALWPVDGRDGGVPDPGLCTGSEAAGTLSCPNLGPNFLQIGTEGGFLPAPAVRVPQPVTYVTDPTAFWVGVVKDTGLALGPAERADVIVDFSAYAGKTLILYNDAPAAWPARVAGYDYYTGAPDLRDSGGYGTGGTFDQATGSWVGGTGPMVGYAPNTRTVMQVIVNATAAPLPAPGIPFVQANLEKEFTAAAPAIPVVNPADPVTGTTKTLFERAQEPIIVGQAAYSTAYPASYFPTNFPWEGISQINDDFLQFVTLAGEQVRVPMHPKGIHDEMGASFDPVYGRMSGNLAMQVPNPTTLNALLMLYGFSDLPTEFVDNSTQLNVTVGTVVTDKYLGDFVKEPDGSPAKTNLADGTQIWNVSHNGVDTHPIHFHIFDVQLINRVGWDGQIALPEANELGWKDTVKISPLMNTIVAVRPRAPSLPFGITNSIRPLNPAIPIDSTMGFAAPLNADSQGSNWPIPLPGGVAGSGFSSINYKTGQAYIGTDVPPFPFPNYKGVITNVLFDFGWEYVWHCHILSHEEMDMMRPIVLNVNSTTPNAPEVTSIAAGVITWIDPTPVSLLALDAAGLPVVPNAPADPETYRNPANEVGFNVYRSADGVTFTQLNTVGAPPVSKPLMANSTTYTDPAPVANSFYKVEAFNAAGSAFSAIASSFNVVVSTTGALTAPAGITLQAAVTGVPATMSITKVDYYSGATYLGTSIAAPYAVIWPNVMAGTYNIVAKATDNLGGVSTSAPLQVVVTGSITADFTAIGAVTAAPGNPGFCEQINFTDVTTGAVTGWNWTINGVTTTTQTTSTAAGALVPGVYPVKFIASAASGETATVTKNVTVINHAPTATPGGPYIVSPGGTVTLTGLGSDPLDAACNPAGSLTYAWNIDNRGAYDYFTASTPALTYAELQALLGVGTHTVTLKVTDVNGGIGIATAQLTVSSGAPGTISVPAASTNGAYIVSWSANPTPGATYMLEESTDNTFATGVSVVTPVPISATQYDITNKVNGTYFYRVYVAAPTVSPYTTSANGCVVTLGTPTVVEPAFSPLLLTKDSQSMWENIIPNALADYFTYVPYTTADAVKLGFPSTCGNLAKGDTASTEDCYTITVKKFAQPLAVQGIFGGGPGLRDLTGAPLSADVYGYGSGGQGWTPPYVDTTKPGVVSNVTVTGNAPAPFADGTLATAGIWHFPAPTIKGIKGRPVRVQWLNDLPNEAPTGLDPSVDCGPHAINCFPYNRIVTHVHGAHVGPESDGLASAWFTPGFATKGEDFVSTRQHGPEGTYYYPMDQEASTIWYHDHAMGTTHNNTNMGMAGFFPITDPIEEALKTCNGLNCKPVLPTGAYELGFALQDRHFDTTGKFAMPDYPIYDLTTTPCVPDPVTGLADGTNCPNGLVKWMKAKDPNNINDTVGHFVPYDALDTATLTNGLNAGAPFGAPSATLEYFGNMPVVNGVVYGKYNVEPRVYRMRFIGGTDSRTWVMQLQRSDNAAVIPFWVIGSEQGLLNNPVPRDVMDLMPGERLDVLVDLSGIPAGTRVIMNNLGDDAPWAGYFDYVFQNTPPQLGFPRSALIPEIMAFDIVPLVGIDNIKTPDAATVLRPVIPAAPAASGAPRVISLMEITDGFGRTMPTIDSRGFKPVGIPVTEIIKLNDVEQWDLVNTTVDAHPMHLHQVAFQVIDRQVLAGFVDPVDDTINQIFTPASYTTTGGVLLPDLWEAGWKDTITAPPGYVTRVRAKFDLIGEYVWHCHILSHEEHDMMRPFVVTPVVTAAGPDLGKGIAPAPASIAVPTASVNGSYTISWVGTAIGTVADPSQYELQEATDSLFATAATIYTGTAPRLAITGKASGSAYYYRVRTIPTAVSGFVTSDWRTGTNAVATNFVVLNVPAGVTQGIASTLTVSLPTAPAGGTVANVEYFNNGTTLLGSNAVAPYSFDWTPAAFGAHSLTAVVTYNLNTTPASTVTSTSAAVALTVLTPAPTITLDTPTIGQAFDLGSTISLAATPSPIAGASVIIVEFSDAANNTLGTDFFPTPGTSQYTASWTPVAGGVYNVKAKAWYTDGSTAVSTPDRAVTINNTVVAPASITVPVNSTTGSYTVSWSPAVQATIGATYTLEESTTSNFAAGTTTTLTSLTSATSFNVTGRNGGTYYYRVNASKSPMTPSGWTAGGNGCLVVSYLIQANASSMGSIVSSSGNLTATNSVWVSERIKTIDTYTYTISAKPGNRITDVTVDGISQGPITSYVFTNVTANRQIRAFFAVDPVYVISAYSNTLGTIESSSGNLISSGAWASETVRPSNLPIYTITPIAGYTIVDVKVNGVSKGPITSFNFAGITSSQQIRAYYGVTYIIQANASSMGSIVSSSGNLIATNSVWASESIVSSASYTYSIAATPGNKITDVTVNGVSQGPITSYVFSNVNANQQIRAYFANDTYTIQSYSSTQGTITSSTGLTSSGAWQFESVTGSNPPVYTIAPNVGFILTDVTVNGVSQGPITTYNFAGLTANQVIRAFYSIAP